MNGGETEMTEQETDVCPFLIPVVADWLWLYPIGAYCHRPGERVRAPARLTVAHVCTALAHFACVGYRASVAPPARDALR